MFNKKNSLHIEGIPVNWDEARIKEKFSLVGSIENVIIIKNKFGQSSGKAIVAYDTFEGATLSFNKFRTSSVGPNPLKVRPCFNPAEQEERKKLRIKICNVPYTITEDQIYTLLSPFVEIEEIIFLYYQ